MCSMMLKVETTRKVSDQEGGLRSWMGTSLAELVADEGHGVGWSNASDVACA